jgi:copper chaperone
MEKQMNLKIAGMSCGHCVARVRKALQEIDGVQVETVEVGSATLRFDPTRTSEAAVVSALGEAGYAVEREP